jgi:hypothetical protein
MRTRDKTRTGVNLTTQYCWLFGSRRNGTSWLGHQLLSYHTIYVHKSDLTERLAVGETMALETRLEKTLGQLEKESGTSKTTLIGHCF